MKEKDKGDRVRDKDRERDAERQREKDRAAAKAVKEQLAEKAAGGLKYALNLMRCLPQILHPPVCFCGRRHGLKWGACSAFSAKPHKFALMQ